MLMGKRILVVEDEPIVALLVEDMLDALGAIIVGPASSFRTALAVLEVEAVDAAVLDVNLGRERSDAVAARLITAGIPFIYATGYGGAALPAGASAVLHKPYRTDQLQAALLRALSHR
jgi:CheY-like chemotaxis protein